MARFFAIAVLAAIMSCGGHTGYGADLSAQSKVEIGYLLSFLKNSGCQFNRNEQWYGAAEAVAHIDVKYNYLLSKNMLSSAEDFIDKAATQSSMSGKPYLVQCGDEVPVPSGVWFREELEKYRLNPH
ncbi:MAG: DUF5329 domain-containing protein [Proteobacteria bacterium]|nr:DUF5329 domain-containing protein [Pseudomonadota bacterium]